MTGKKHQINQKHITQIKDWLQATGKRQKDLADMLGTFEATVNRWIRGEFAISQAYLQLLKAKGIIKE